MELPWVEKYRPKKIEDFVIDKYTLNLLETFTYKSIPHIIFYGFSGTGKTSLAYYLCNKLKIVFKEFNASDSRGVNNINEIITFYKYNYEKKTIIILDEADNITLKAQELIVQIMDTYPNIIFIFTCNNTNDISHKILNRIFSLKIEFSKNNLIYERLKNILDKEGVNYEKGSIIQIIKECNYDIRMTLNKLEILNNIFDTISLENLQLYHSDSIDLDTISLFNCILEKNDIDTIIYKYKNFKKNGLDYIDFIYFLIEILVNYKDDIFVRNLNKNEVMGFLDILYHYTFKITSLYIYSDLQFFDVLYRLHCFSWKKKLKNVV